MEVSAQPSKNQGGDHDYFVSSETVESWKTNVENRPKNATVTVLNNESIMTSNRRNEDEFEFIEEEIVESLMIEHDEDSDNNSRLCVNDTIKMDAASEKTITRDEKSIHDGENAEVVDTSDSSVAISDQSDSHSKPRTDNRVLPKSDSSQMNSEKLVDVTIPKKSVSSVNTLERNSGTKKIVKKYTILNNCITQTLSKSNSSNVKGSNNSSRDNDVMVQSNPRPNKSQRQTTVNNDSTSCEDRQRRNTNESTDFCLTLEMDRNVSEANNVNDTIIDSNDSENDASSKVCDSSTMSIASGDDSVDFSNEPGDEVDVSDVSSSFAENESINDISNRNKTSSTKKARRRQPPIMIGYKKRRKVQHLKKLDDEYDLAQKLSSHHNGMDVLRISETEGSVADERSEGSSHHAFESSSSEENLFEGVNSTLRPSIRKRSGSTSEPSDSYCWTCHKDAGEVFKCLACPRVFHCKCYVQISGIDYTEDPNNFQCPECVAILRADNVNTRSPTLATVNLDQLCVSLKHVIDLLKAQKDSHYFWGPVDTKEFPHYREYVVHPMDLMMLEKNVSEKVYGCTEAFLADVKWIVHNSIVFNSKASKITNVAKNLLKICKREIAEIETCAECYYNSLVRIDTWFIEVCKRPHILVWARLKGYPPWPAKALKCKDNMVDCRFFGAHDKAWVPLKDCFLYSQIPPQPTKMKKTNHLELGIKELERHISKLKDKFGVFTYPPARTPYQPAFELDQIRLMLPNFNPKSVGRLVNKYLIHPDRVKEVVKPKILFNEKEIIPMKEESDIDDEKRMEEADSESTCTDDQDKPLEVPTRGESLDTDTSCSSSENETSNLPDEWKIDKSHNLVESSNLRPGQKKLLSASKAAGNTDSNADAKNSINISTKIVERNKLDVNPKPKKFVVVRNIDTINASVMNNERNELTEIGSKVSSTSHESDGLIHRTNVPSTSSTLPIRSVLPKPSATSTNKRKRSIEEISKDVACKSKIVPKDSDQSEFDLDKVKDEPADVDFIPSNSDEVIIEKHIIRPAKMVQLSPASSKPKRVCDDENSVSANNVKKLKPDSNARSVNISENVTLSVVNPLTNADGGKVRVVSVKQGSQKNLSQPVNSGYIVVDGNSEVPPNVGRSKLISAPTGKLVIGSSVTPRSQMKILPRPSVQGPVSQTNGPSAIPVKPPSVTVNPLKVDSTSNLLLANGLDEFLLNEYQNHFRKFFEDTFEKLAGRGDLRAKIFSLQKEVETLKRNHEFAIDELKREYETQIAELRATSLAKTQFDLAAERLKFEQEKEKAVKEAKSKQWCSNCQKSANYYCCWNTAYCDFECQKEHWIHHMHVCKNDVKKKAAESSENEPPRIMMQNDVTNNYILNGYDKSGTATTYSYQNSNSLSTGSRNFKKQAISKNTTTTKINYRPLLPRISSTTNNSLSASSSSVSTTHLTSTSSFSENVAYQTVSSSTTNSPRPHSSVTIRQTTLFHK